MVDRNRYDWDDDDAEVNEVPVERKSVQEEFDLDFMNHPYTFADLIQMVRNPITPKLAKLQFQMYFGPGGKFILNPVPVATMLYSILGACGTNNISPDDFDVLMKEVADTYRKTMSDPEVIERVQRVLNSTRGK